MSLLHPFRRLRARLVVLMAIFPAFFLASAGAQQEPEFRGLWVDTWNAGFYTAAQIDQLVLDAQRGNLNAILPQVRRRGDAFYTSTLEPKNPAVSPSSFDPLAYLIQKAKAANPPIEVHAWIVAYPMGSSNSHPDHVLNRHPDWLMETNTGEKLIGGQFWVDPAHPEVQQHTLDVALDIITRYNVDGLHFDYIRYPSRDSGYNPVSVARFNQRHGRSGIPATNDTQWMQFRRDAVTELVRRFYLEAIAVKPGIKVSAATIGQAPGITTTSEWPNSSAYAQRLQNWRAWMEEGILDLNIPMLYFNQNDWPLAWSRWNTFAKNHKYNRHLAIGMGWYINSVPDTLGQINDTRQPTSAGNRANGLVGYYYHKMNTDGVSRTNFLNTLSSPSGPFPQKVPTQVMPWKSNPTRGHAKGLVSAGNSDHPFEHALVTFTGPQSRTARTDANGFYGVVDLLPGTYTVTASVPNAPYDPVTRQITVTAGQVRTSDFALQFAPAAVIVIDNPDAQFWGSWNPATSSSQYGSDYRLAWPVPGAPTATATYRPNISIPGTYHIDIWYVSGTNRSPDVPYEIGHSSGTTLLTYDQRTGGGQWRRLASDVHLAAGTGGYVQVANNASPSVVTADAVRFTLVEADPDPALFFEEPIVYVGSQSATITWETVEPAVVRVEYGLSQAVTTLSPETTTVAGEHSVTIGGLLENRQYHLRLHARQGTQTYASNWLTFNTTDVVTVIVDDPVATFSGPWTLVNSTNGWGSSYRWASSVAGSATATATYRPNLPVSGRYDIALYYYSPSTSTNRASDVPHLISHHAGSQTVLVNQTIHNRQWATIAENQPFQAGTAGFVRISNNLGYTGKVILADGMRFTLRDSPPEHQLSTTVQGSGGISRSPASSPYPHGTFVQLTATPAPGWVFARWEGDLEGNRNPARIQLYRDREVTAVFHPLYELTVQMSGEGTVEVTPNQATYPAESEVEVLAIPADGWIFVGWTGDASGQDNPALLWMDGRKNLVANFGFSYDAWAEANFTPAELGNPDFSGPQADPFSHGIRNLLKYAFGIDLRQPERDRLPVASVEGDRLVLSFTRLRGESGLAYQFEISQDLISWEPANGLFTETSVEAYPDGRTERVTVKADAAVMTGNRRSVRLRVDPLWE
jgi:uncharacterized lipoprotein YddW (UPF0748 family)